MVGIALSLVIFRDDYSLHHTWVGITNRGQFDTHESRRWRDGTS